MIQIPEQPTVTACGSCMHPLRWLWDPTIGDWVAFVPGPARDTPRLHGCRPLQAPATWRQLDHGDPPSAAYLAAKEALKSKERTDEKETD